MNAWQLVRLTVFSRTVLAVLLGAAGNLAADTILFYRMEDGAAGSAATSLASIGTSSAAAGAQAGGGTFSADIPAAFIYDPVTNTYYPNTTSVQTDSAGRFDVTGSVTEVRNFTAEAFIKSDGTVQFARILQKQRGTGADASWRIDPRGGTPSSPTHGIRADSQNTVTGYGKHNQGTFGSDLLNTGQWQHVALTYTDGVEGTTSGVLRLYVDYALSATLTMDIAGVMQYDGNPFMIAGAPGSNGFIGLMDEVRFSDGILTPDQFLVATPIPEPGTCLMLLFAACGLTLCRRRVRA